VTAYEGDSNINDSYSQMDRERKGNNQELDFYDIDLLQTSGICTVFSLRRRRGVMIFYYNKNTVRYVKVITHFWF
jgi:hypothetical protein